MSAEDGAEEAEDSDSRTAAETDDATDEAPEGDTDASAGMNRQSDWRVAMRSWRMQSWPARSSSARGVPRRRR